MSGDPRGLGIPYNGLCGVVPSDMDTFLRPKVFQRVENLELYIKEFIENLPFKYFLKEDSLTNKILQKNAPYGYVILG